MKESANNSKGEHMIEDVETENPEMKGGLVVGSKKEGLLKTEEPEVSVEVMQGIQATAIATTTITTKSGRASKPSTPVIPTPEPIRSRSSRTILDNSAPSTGKRSHKKGAGQAAQQLIAQAQTADDDTTSSVQGDEDDAEPDADEPTYCYCNGVSYGEMVGCDADGCAREWFHLACVGLRVAPKGNGEFSSSFFLFFFVLIFFLPWVLLSVLFVGVLLYLLQLKINDERMLTNPLQQNGFVTIARRT